MLIYFISFLFVCLFLWFVAKREISLTLKLGLSAYALIWLGLFTWHVEIGPKYTSVTIQNKGS